MLKFKRVAPQTYIAKTDDGREAKVVGEFIDDRDYDGGHAGWQWAAFLDDGVTSSADPRIGVTFDTKRDAVAALVAVLGGAK